jgi:hypothetical protein
VLLGERAALLEPANDVIPFGQMIDLVSACRMRLDRENLAVHPKAANAVVGAELEGGKKGVGVFKAETAQLCQGVGPLHLADGGGRRRDELDRLVPKQAAEAEANHGIPQFIAVFDSCTTVAMVPGEFLRERQRQAVDSRLGRIVG